MRNKEKRRWKGRYGTFGFIRAGGGGFGGAAGSGMERVGRAWEFKNRSKKIINQGGESFPERVGGAAICS